MRNTIIPAQITTVEDKIAGSLSMNQVLILMIPVLWSAFVYILLIPAMKLSLYKVGMILAVTLICLILALRFKDKIILEWLGVLVRYRLRPRYYLFNKNDLTHRTVDIPVLRSRHAFSKKPVGETKKTYEPEIKVADLIKIEQLIENGKVALRYQFDRKQP